MAKESTKEVTYFGTDEQGWMGISFTSDAEYTVKNNMISTIIGDALDIYLVEIIREKMGGVYSPMAQVGLSKYPTGKFQVMVMLGCNPGKTDVLKDACVKILNDMTKKGVDKKTLNKVKTSLISTREKNIQTNNFWLSYINSKALYGEDFNAVNEYKDLVNSITNKDIINFLKSYLNTNVCTRVDLLPETMKK